nr:hypothetical protein [Tanacetum cinerariifolium]
AIRTNLVYQDYDKKKKDVHRIMVDVVAILELGLVLRREAFEVESKRGSENLF